MIVNDQFYKQTHGISRGSPLSLVLLKIWMSNFETKLFKDNINVSANVEMWCRYVDDIFCVWSGIKWQLTRFINSLNSMNKHIKSILEEENRYKLVFLDFDNVRGALKM